MKRIFQVGILVLVFGLCLVVRYKQKNSASLAAAPSYSSCNVTTSGQQECSDGTLYKCKCITTSYGDGICIQWGWEDIGSCCTSCPGECIAYGWNCRDTFGGVVSTDSCNCTGVDVCCLFTNTSNVECQKASDCGSCQKCVIDKKSPSGVVTVSHCEAVDPINGVCSDGGSRCPSNPPSASCSTGTPSGISSNSGSWTWTCSGSCGGGVGSCSVDKKSVSRGICGTASEPGVVFYNNPPIKTDLPSSGEMCSAGDPTWSGGDKVGTDGDLNWTCQGSCASDTDCSAVNDPPPPPVITPEIHKDNIPVLVDALGRSHICQLEFGGTKLVGWKVTATDVNGLDDVGTIQLRLRSDSGLVTTSDPVDSANGVADIVIDTSSISVGTYHVEVLVNDRHPDAGNTGWIDTTRTFRVWDCLVNVSGRIYDGSGQAISCSAGVGYSNPIPSESVFGLAYFLGSGSPRTMTVNSPDFASGDKLYWNTTANYQPVFDSFPGADPTEMRVNGSTCVAGVSIDPRAYVDPYTDNPSMTVDYSSVLDQDAWFSVTDGSVLSTAKIDNYVPVTCTTDSCATSNNGVVWSTGKTTLSAYDKVPSQNRFNQKPLNLKDTTYDYFVKNYFYKVGVGITVVGSKNWSEISSLKDIVLIKGDLNIDQDITGSDLKMIIVDGNISVGSTDVGEINAVLLGKSFTATGDSSKQLVINGSVYTSESITLTRSFIDKSANNTTPAVIVNYDPSVIFKIPKEVARSVTQWRMN